MTRTKMIEEKTNANCKTCSIILTRNCHNFYMVCYYANCYNITIIFEHQENLHIISINDNVPKITQRFGSRINTSLATLLMNKLLIMPDG